MKLTRTLEERLVNLHRQNKLVGGLVPRRWGRKPMPWAPRLHVEQGDVLLLAHEKSRLAAHPRARRRSKSSASTRRVPNSPTRGRDLGTALRRYQARFHRPHLAARRHGRSDGGRYALVQGARREARRGLRSTWATARRAPAHFTRESTSPPSSARPLVVIAENNGYAYSTPVAKQSAAKQFVDKAAGYGVAG